MVAFWLALGAIGLYLIKVILTEKEPGWKHLPPLEILNRRYAAGDISEEEYDRIKQIIESRI